MTRADVIEKLIEWLETADRDAKILFGRQIYQRYAHKMQDKGGGVNINLTDMSTEFLLTLYNDTQNKPEALLFWQTL